MFTTFRNNNYHMVPVATLGKLYTNSFLVLMNSRRSRDSTYYRSTETSGLWGDLYPSTTAASAGSHQLQRSRKSILSRKSNKDLSGGGDGGKGQTDPFSSSAKIHAAGPLSVEVNVERSIQRDDNNVMMITFAVSFAFFFF
jgi:hypothetical protein